MRGPGDKSAMSPRVKPRVVRYLAFSALGVGLIWAIITHSLVAALVEIEPSQALVLAPANSAALLAMAERKLATLRSQRLSSNEPSSGYPDEEQLRRTVELRQWVSAVLAQEPGNARALAILGELEAGKGKGAATLLRAAARRSLREFYPHAWLVHEAIEQQDWALAMQRGDVLMRLHENAIAPLTPLLAEMAEKPDASAAILAAVARAPPWRARFLGGVLGAVTDARTPLRFLLAMKEAGTPPTIYELRSYLDFLVERKFYDLAYYTWLQFLPRDQLGTVGLLFNGNFEIHPTGLPFDWVLPSEGSATVAIVRRADRPSDRALFIELGHGRVDVGRISQLLRLQPGRHRVTGNVMGDVVGRRGVRWRVACLDQPSRLIAESEMIIGRIEAWTAFSFFVIVPEIGCRAQDIRLELDARTPSERLISGSIWFDDLSIRRAP